MSTGLKVVLGWISFFAVESVLAACADLATNTGHGSIETGLIVFVISTGFAGLIGMVVWSCSMFDVGDL